MKELMTLFQGKNITDILHYLCCNFISVYIYFFKNELHIQFHILVF